jgi:UDP-N-acetylmuramoyl-tripeptide--D-alanyl-D-alanine ligase
MRTTLQSVLKYAARTILAKYRPRIVAITGSVGKTSTKEAIYSVLKTRFRVRRNIKNYNNEIGLPLTIIGEETGGSNLFAWIRILWRAAVLMILRKKDYPEILVLEMGMDRPGDITYLASFVKPDIAVVSAIGEIPVHVEFFEGPEEVVKEKAVLPRSVQKDGRVVLNADDKFVAGMHVPSHAKTMLFGFSEKAEMRAHDYVVRQGSDGKPEGISFKIAYKGSDIPLHINNTYGRPQVYASLAAASTGVAFGIDLATISDALTKHQAPQGRMNVIEGIKHTWILDDTYNAAPLSTLEAIDAVAQLKGKRKVLILGDMRELGKFSEQAHRMIGKRAAEVADVLVCVGAQAGFIAEEAQTKEAVEIFVYASSEETLADMDRILKEGDIVLVKGSQGMRMEKITEEIMAHPEQAKELLVRQDAGWKR